MTTQGAKVTNSTSVMMQTVAEDVNSIGYISLGSLDESVTAVKIDGVEATAENVANGTQGVPSVQYRDQRRSERRGAGFRELYYGR